LSREVALRRLFELLLRLLGVRPRLAHRVDLPQHLAFALVDLLVGDFLVGKRHELADCPLLVLELVAHLHDEPRNGRRPGDGLDDRKLSAFDALGDLDLAFARQQGNGAHLAQIHADGVVGLVEGAGREIQLQLLRAFAGAIEELLFPVGLLRIDNFNAGAAERAEEVVQLLRGRDVRRKQLVDLVVEQVAFFLADRDELPHLVIFFFDRQRRSSVIAGTNSLV
jgi:hypothetical protein